MGTIINGNKWNGIAINGKKAYGLIKNGNIFYKMNIPKKLYKRRIMLGDNLKGKTIYSDFSKIITDRFIDDRKSSFIICNDDFFNSNFYYIQHSVTSESGLYQDISSSLIDKEYLYRYNDTQKNYKQQNAIIFNDKDYLVTSVFDTYESYRGLYIEDENIRPLQIGDKIINGTKLYFNFPDNIINKLSNGNNSIIECTEGSLFSYSKTSSTINIYLDKPSSLNIYYVGYNLDTVTYILTNKSFNIIDSLNTTITNINNSDVASLILVDTTTLG